jgi:hypothetical protein
MNANKINNTLAPYSVLHLFSVIFNGNEVTELLIYYDRITTHISLSHLRFCPHKWFRTATQMFSDIMHTTKQLTDKKPLFNSTFTFASVYSCDRKKQSLIVSDPCSAVWFVGVVGTRSVTTKIVTELVTFLNTKETPTEIQWEMIYLHFSSLTPFLCTFLTLSPSQVLIKRYRDKRVGNLLIKSF